MQRVTLDRILDLKNYSYKGYDWDYWGNLNMTV